MKETDNLSNTIIGGMANVPDTLLAAVQALEDGDKPDSWLLDDEPKKLSDYFKGKVQIYKKVLSRVNNIRRECLTPYRAVQYDCVKLKGFVMKPYNGYVIYHF